MGELAAISTSLCWAFSAVIFTYASHRLGSTTLNRLRLLFALTLLVLSHWLIFGRLLPTDAGAFHWGWLGLSGFLGLTLGDLALYQSFIMAGPSLGTLILSSTPVLSSIVAWLFLGEELSLGKITGILIAVAGIALVVADRRNPATPGHVEHRRFLKGIFFGVLAALGQTIGLVLTKHGLQNDFPALSGVVIRMLVATVLMWIPAILSGKAGHTLATLRNRTNLLLVAGGSLIGPFTGIWLSTYAVQMTKVGVAATLTSLSPIFLLPITKWVMKEHVSVLSVIGTAIAISGVSIILLL